MEDSHATVLDLRKIKPEDLKLVDAYNPSEETESGTDSTPSDERISFFAVYDGHGGMYFSLLLHWFSRPVVTF